MVYVIPKPFTRLEKSDIPSCDGSQTIARAKRVFENSIEFFTASSNNIHFDLDVPSVATPKTQVRMLEREASRLPYKYLSYHQVFSPIGKNVPLLAFTQAQVVEFAATHRNRFVDGGSNSLFLFTSQELLYWASIGKGACGLTIVIHDFNYEGIVASSCGGYRIVVP
jgi:hypothetical protein